MRSKELEWTLFISRDNKTLYVTKDGNLTEEFFFNKNLAVFDNKKNLDEFAKEHNIKDYHIMPTVIETSIE